MDSTGWRSAEAGDGEARTGRRERGGDAEDERSEANSVSAGDVAEGGEPSETTRRTRQAVQSRSDAVNGFDVQSAPR
ncbi:MAG: hypothetical protein OXN89_02725 [Bryobacterales bacterium]|nr:hypothetical protein [Bryobacterales bacterium]